MESFQYSSKNDPTGFSLHDCRVTAIKCEDRLLLLEFTEGFIICPGSANNPDTEHALRTGRACVAIELLEEPFCDTDVYYYKPAALRKGVDLRRRSTLAELTERVNSGAYQLEIVDELYGWQCLRYSGYLWRDKRPYHTETDVELRYRSVTYYWNDTSVYGG